MSRRRQLQPQVSASGNCRSVTLALAADHCFALEIHDTISARHLTECHRPSNTCDSSKSSHTITTLGTFNYCFLNWHNSCSHHGWNNVPWRSPLTIVLILQMWTFCTTNLNTHNSYLLFIITQSLLYRFRTDQGFYTVHEQNLQASVITPQDTEGNTSNWLDTTALAKRINLTVCNKTSPLWRHTVEM